MLVFVVLTAMALAGVLQSLRTQSGTQWWLSQVPGLTVDQPSGALLGDFSAQRVQYQGSTSAQIDKLSWTGLDWRLLPERSMWAELHINTLKADRVALQMGPSTHPSAAPTNLAWPGALEITQLLIDALEITPEAPLTTPPTAEPISLRDLRASLHLGADAGTAHGLTLQRLAWGHLEADGKIRIQTAAPLETAVLLHVRSVKPKLGEGTAQDFVSAPWVATVTAQGPLAEPHVQADLHTVQAAEHSSPLPVEHPAQAHLSLNGTLRPWAAWPLGALQAEASGIDLSSIHPAAPRTALRAKASAETHSADQPAIVKLDVSNDAAGLWNEQRLPLRHLMLELHAQPDQLSEVQLHALSAEWGTRSQSAGRLEGQGHFSRDHWALDGRLVELQPSLLDSRATPVQLTGPVRLSVQGQRWDAQAEWSGVLLDAPSGAAVKKSAAELRFALSTQRPSTPKDPETWTLSDLQARIGEARLEASGTVSRPSASTPWQAKGSAKLVRFDPLPWWPGPEKSVWREGGHHFNGEASVDIRLIPSARSERPANPTTADPLAPWLTWLQGWRGMAQVNLTDSRLAEVPLSGHAELQNDGTSPKFNLQLQAAENTLQAEGSLPRQAANTRPTAAAPTQLDFKVAAPNLARLNPWFTLLSPQQAANRQLSGQLQGSGHLNGDALVSCQGSNAACSLALKPDGGAIKRHLSPDTTMASWGHLQTEGQFNAVDLRWGSQRLQGAQLRWQLGSAASDPLNMELEANNLAWQERSLSTLALQVHGRVEDHRLHLEAHTPGQPPAWVQSLQSIQSPEAAAKETQPATSTTLVLDAQSSFQHETGSGHWPVGWRGSIEKLQLSSLVSGISKPTNGTTPWFRLAQPLALTAKWSEPGLDITASPGQADLAGTALRWDAIQWAHVNGKTDQLNANLRIDSLPVASWLAHLQPDFGWSGDLTLGLTAQIHTQPEFRVEVAVDRRFGDLQITDDNGTQKLGLQTLHLMLQMTQSQWSFAQAVVGRNLGVISGALVANLEPGTHWPTATSPLQGVVELQVANLRAWGNWLPAGWRLGGQLHLGANVGGLWGAPQITGAIEGRSLSMHHALEGVDMTDGTVDIQLQGNTARIERFTARSGTGSLQLQGQAQLDGAPQAQLKLDLDHFQLLGRVDRKLVGSGQATLNLSPDLTTVTGELMIDEGLVDFSQGDAPRLAEDVQVLRAQPSKSASAPSRRVAKVPTRQPPVIQVTVNLGEKLHLRGRGLETKLRGNLQLTTTEGALQVNGKVNAEEGTYRAYAQKLNIDRGVVSFNGDASNPRLDIEATRPNTDIRVGVTITGSAKAPRVRLFSEPDMPDADKLSWLLLGRGSDGLASTDISLLQSAALALLSGEEEGVSDQLMKAIGIDDLSIRQSDGAVKDTVVSLGRQLSRRWYVGYERSLNATEGSWQLIYRMAQRFTLRAQTGHENSVDLIWTWRWQ